MRDRVKIRISESLSKTRAMLSRLKQWRLSPLSAILLALLSAVTVGTALFAAAALLWPVSSSGGAAVPDWTPPTLAVVELDPPKPPSADVETLSRPIFSKTRKPSPKAAVAVDAANISEAPTGVVVTAIVRNKKVTQAFMISTEAPDGAWRKEGDQVDSWTLHKILPAEVVLQSGDRLTKVKLYTPPPETPEAPVEGGFSVGPGATPAAPPEAPPVQQDPSSNTPPPF